MVTVQPYSQIAHDEKSFLYFRIEVILWSIGNFSRAPCEEHFAVLGIISTTILDLVRLHIIFPFFFLTTYAIIAYSFNSILCFDTIFIDAIFGDAILTFFLFLFRSLLVLVALRVEVQKEEEEDGHVDGDEVSEAVCVLATRRVVSPDAVGQHNEELHLEIGFERETSLVVVGIF